MKGTARAALRAVVVVVVVVVGVLGQPWLIRPALAQSVPARSDEIDLGRVFALVPSAFERVFERGSAELFRLLEDVELLHIESEIDRYVGRPRELNDSTSYKLSLLPYEIQYPIFGPLVDQMTRLDSVRSNRIYMVTPDSVSLVDLSIRPVETLEEFTGRGAGPQVEGSLLSHFNTREIADLSVFLLAQEPFFPATEADWEHTKHQIARAGVPLLLGLLGTGAAIDAGALANSGTVIRHGDQLELRYYGAFRNFGVHLHPYLRGGMSVRLPGVEAAAGLADRIRPTAAQPDSAFELALREGWLSQLAQPLGLDAFFEAAFRRSLREPPGFTGERTQARAGFFFKQGLLPGNPDFKLRGSVEGETDFGQRLHLVGALGAERPRSGLTTLVQGSLIPADRASLLSQDARLTVFVVGTMEPVTAAFVDEMNALAHATRLEASGLAALERRRDDWDRGLLARGVGALTPAETRAMLAEREQMLVDGERRLERLASTLADYLESRDRAYGILHYPRSDDGLHGPLDASVVLTARGRVLGRLGGLSDEMTESLGKLVSLRGRITAIENELPGLQATLAPSSALLGARRRELAQLQQAWAVEATRARQQLSAREQLHADGGRILAATGGDAKAIRQWDRLDVLERVHLARLAATSGP